MCMPFQWEKGNFDHHSSHIFIPIFLKLLTKKHIRDTNQHAKFGKDWFTGGVWANIQILDVHSGLPFFIFYFLDSSLSVPVAPRGTLRPMRAQNTCFRPRKCLFGVITMKIPKNVNFGGLNRRFYYDILKSDSSIDTKFAVLLHVHKWTS